MAKVETVKIVSKEHVGGCLVINKSDLTKDHKLFVEKEKEKEKEEVQTPIKRSTKK